MRIKKTTFYLVAIFLLAFFLRVFAAHNTHVSTDEMIYSVIPLNIISAGRLGTIEQAPLFFYLTDVGYKILGGITAISIRSTAIILGSLGIFVIYLLSKEIFEDKKSAYISALIYAASGFVLRFNYEMDMTAFFFGLLSMFFFIKFLKGKSFDVVFSALFLALGMMAKPIIGVFIVGYVVAFLMKNKKMLSGKINKKVLKHILFAILVFLVIVTPVLTYNYLLYKEKGITDFYFTGILGIGQNIYQGLEIKPWKVSVAIETIFVKGKKFFMYDWLIMIFGLIGLGYGWKKNKEGTALLALSAASLLLYLGGKTSSNTHYSLVPIVLSIFAGFTITHIAKKINFKHVIPTILVILVITTSFFVQAAREERSVSGTILLRDYVHKNIPEEAVVVLDPRIYRGVHAWVFNDKHYIDGSHYPQFVESVNSNPNQRISVPLYYVECDGVNGNKNCGWKKEDLARIYDYGDQLSQQVTINMQEVGTVQAAEKFIISRGTINLPLGGYEAIDRTHNFWFTPVGWKYTDAAPDNYTPKTFFDSMLNKFAFLILYLDTLLALLTPVTLYFIFKRESETNQKKENHESVHQLN